MMDPTKEQTPEQALLTLRILWGAQILGIVVVATVMAMVFSDSSESQPGAEGLWPAVYAGAWGLLLVGMAVGWFVRNQVYKRYWEAGAVTPAGYVQGNIVFVAITEGAVILGLILSLVFGTPWVWAVLPAALAVAVLLGTFPGGGPMREQAPRLGVSERRER
jgi:hypothetical protein